MNFQDAIKSANPMRNENDMNSQLALNLKFKLAFLSLSLKGILMLLIFFLISSFLLKHSPIGCSDRLYASEEMVDDMYSSVV